MMTDSNRQVVYHIPPTIDSRQIITKSNKKAKMARRAKKVSTRRLWTDEEKQILINELIENSDNIQACFFEVSKKINRTPGAISTYWYSSLSREEGVNVYGTLTYKNYSRNRKLGQGVRNKKGTNGVPITTSFWERFVRMIKKYI